MLHSMEDAFSSKFQNIVQKARFNHNLFAAILVNHLMDGLTASTVQKLSKGETP